MKRFKLFLEVFDKTHPYKWYSPNNAIFTSKNGVEYAVSFLSINGRFNMAWGNTQQQEQDKDDIFSIIGTVIKITKEYIEKNKPNEIHIVHQDRKRFNIFKRELQKIKGYTMNIDTSTQHPVMDLIKE